MNKKVLEVKMNKIDKLKIGNVEIEKTAGLAPMASVADRAYRILCKRYHASYLVSEMISSKGLCYSDRKTAELCTVTDEERPMALQIFGEDADFMQKSVDIIEKYTPSIIDINMGCPVPKVVNNLSGSALMKNPKLAEDIVRAVVKESSVPVTVKFRSGWDKDNINAVDFAKRMESAGASAVAVHGRTREQFYSGKADWDIIRQVKEAVSIPVMGNGDVDSVESCVEMYRQTGCDLVLIGRASYGRPWLFRQIYEHFAGLKVSSEPSFDERLDIMLTHAKMIIDFKDEKTGMREARKHVAWYLKGIAHAASYRNACAELNTYDDLRFMVDRIRKTEKEESENI